jgi:hypothetical protein
VSLQGVSLLGVSPVILWLASLALFAAKAPLSRAKRPMAVRAGRKDALSASLLSNKTEKFAL